MYQRPLLAGIILCSLYSCGSSKPAATTNAQDVIPTQEIVHIPVSDSIKIIVDGDLSDWRAPIAFNDHNTGINTSLSADTQNLYIAMHIFNGSTQMKMLKMGMQLYIDPTNQKSQAITITYPVLDNNMQPGLEQPANKSNTKAAMISRAVMLQTKGLKIFHDGMHLKKNNNGLAFALGTDGNNNLVYEAAIPLREIYGADFRYTKGTLPLSVGVKINGFEKTEDQKKQQITPVDDLEEGAQNRGAGGGGGRRGGGGGRKGGQLKYDKDAYNINKDVVFWMKASLD